MVRVGTRGGVHSLGHQELACIVLQLEHEVEFRIFIFREQQCPQVILFVVAGLTGVAYIGYVVAIELDRCHLVEVAVVSVRAVCEFELLVPQRVGTA